MMYVYTCIQGRAKRAGAEMGRTLSPSGVAVYIYIGLIGFF